jgi:hypothetical protein
MSDPIETISDLRRGTRFSPNLMPFSTRLLLDSSVVASFAFAVAMIFQDNPARARPSP